MARREADKAREEAERARASAEHANRAKSQFLAVMSHELRTPLNAIAGHVQLMQMGLHGPVTEGQVAALARIERGQRHLLRLINDVLNLARIETGRLEYAITEVVVQDVVAELAPMVEPQLAAKSLTYRLRLPAEPVIVHADREKLAQILLNLVSNACKFTPARGTVTIEIPRPTRVDGRVFVQVADTGVGVPMDKQEQIFEPFVQVQAGPTRTVEGAGLGLAISRDLARGMGGDLRVRSAPGGGSTFTLELAGRAPLHVPADADPTSE
jgi:signal transduction histidine kinase